MDLGLDGKVAIVTGASKGIGLAVVEALRAEGAQVVAGARGIDALEGLDGVPPVAVDLTDPAGPGQLVAAAVEAGGGVDVLVNNVGGVHPRLEGFESIADADFAAAFELNFFAAIRTTRAVIPEMRKRGEGAIVNVNSVNSFLEPDSLVADYGAAKAAHLNVAKSLSQELGPQGIRVTSVAPGPVATDLWLGDHGVAATVGGATGSGADSVREAASGQMATGRFTTPAEVAAVVTLLCSPLVANVTGANWVIDGGLDKTT